MKLKFTKIINESICIYACGCTNSHTNEIAKSSDAIATSSSGISFAKISSFVDFF